MKYQKDNSKYQKDNCCGASKTMFLYSTSFKNTCAAIPLWKTHFALLKQSTSAFWKLRGPRKTYSGASKRPTKRFKRASKRFKALLNTHNTSPLFAWAWFISKRIFQWCIQRKHCVCSAKKGPKSFPEASNMTSRRCQNASEHCRQS